MKALSRAALGALMFAGTSLAAAMPASASVDVGISFGDPDYNFDPCDYYDYYDAAPPWGLPQDYCEYPVYFEPVYFDGSWYRGPIYYRWTHGRRLFWLNGGWREDGWRGGSRPGRIAWSNRGSHFRGGNWHGGHEWHGGVGRRPHDNDGGHDRHPWTGNNGRDHERSWVGVPPQNHDRDNANRNERGGWGGDHGGGSHFGADHGGFGGDHGGGGGGHHH